MFQQLTKALVTSIDALKQVPGTQLQYILSTLQQLRKDLRNAGIPMPVELDDLTEHAAVSKAEEQAILQGVYCGEFDEADEYYEEEMPSEALIQHITDEYGTWNDEKECYELNRSTAIELALQEKREELPFWVNWV